MDGNNIFPHSPFLLSPSPSSKNVLAPKEQRRADLCELIWSKSNLWGPINRNILLYFLCQHGNTEAPTLIKTRKKCPYTPAATMCHMKGREVIELWTLWPIWTESHAISALSRTSCNFSIEPNLMQFQHRIIHVWLIIKEFTSPLTNSSACWLSKFFLRVQQILDHPRKCYKRLQNEP